MKIWEYMQVTVATPHDIADKCNSLGSSGWELVTVVYGRKQFGSVALCYLVFKRGAESI